MSVLLVGIGLPRQAWAQPRNAASLDALDDARRARSIVDDFARMDETRARDREGVRRALVESTGDGNPPPAIIVSATAAGAQDRIGGYRVFTRADERAVLDIGWVALSVGLDAYRQRWGVHLFALPSHTSLGVQRPARGGDRKAEIVDVAGYGNSLVGVTGYALYPWVQAGAALLTPLRRSASTELVEGQVGEVAPDVARLATTAGVPALHLSQSVIVGGRAQRIETAYLDLREVPLGTSRFSASAKLAYLSNERQTYSALGAAYKTGYLTIYGEGATEYNPVRLRHLRVRAQVGGAGVDDGLYGGFFLYSDVSLFHSRFLEERTGATMRPGVDVGMELSVGHPFFAFVVNAYAGVNRPQLLGLFPESVGHAQTGLRLLLRLPLWAFGE